MNTQETIREIARCSHLGFSEVCDLWNRGHMLRLTDEQMIVMRDYLPEAIALAALGCSYAQITANADKVGIILLAVRTGLVDPAQIPTSRP